MNKGICVNLWSNINYSTVEHSANCQLFANFFESVNVADDVSDTNFDLYGISENLSLGSIYLSIDERFLFLKGL